MNNKIIKILIPIVAVVIIFQSVVLVSNLEKGTNIVDENSSQTTNIDKDNKEEIPILEIKIDSENKEMVVGQEYLISVGVNPKEDFNLNALDLYLKFDPEMMDISELISNGEMSEPDFIKVSEAKSVLVSNFLFGEKEGMAFLKDQEINILTFKLVPKKNGLALFEISTGDSEGDSVTMFVDKVTSKALPFVGNKLEIKMID